MKSSYFRLWIWEWLGKPHCYASAKGWWLCCCCYWKWLTLKCGVPTVVWCHLEGHGCMSAVAALSDCSHLFLCFILLKDWNTFLLRFNDLDLCVSENETLKHLTNDTTTPESTMISGQARVSTQSPQALEDSGPVNISVAITLTLDPLKPFGGYSRNVTHLYSTILGHQIGLSGMWVLASSLSDFLKPQQCMVLLIRLFLIFACVSPFVEFELNEVNEEPFLLHFHL